MEQLADSDDTSDPSSSFLVGLPPHWLAVFIALFPYCLSPYSVTTCMAFLFGYPDLGLLKDRKDIRT